MKIERCWHKTDQTGVNEDENLPRLAEYNSSGSSSSKYTGNLFGSHSTGGDGAIISGLSPADRMQYQSAASSMSHTEYVGRTGTRRRRRAGLKDGRGINCIRETELFFFLLDDG